VVRRLRAELGLRRANTRLGFRRVCKLSYRKYGGMRQFTGA
jgi:hypothetical protein